MKLLFRIAFIHILLAPLMAEGQNYPVYDSYPLNPYLYNPAEAASDNMYVFFNQRQQWTGLEGAPSVSTLNFNTQLDMTHVGVGAKISSYKRGLLNTTDVQGTFAYGVPLSKADALYFGISAGVLSKGFNSSKVFDPNDPAIANYLAEKALPTMSAGVVYKTASGFNLGIALPQMLEKSVITESNESAKLSPFNQIWFSTYYKKKVEGKIVSKKNRGLKTRGKAEAGFAPLEFYATYKLSSYQTSQFEVLAKLNLSNNFWLSAGYRQQYGLLTGVGFSVSKFLLNYAFEPGSQPEKGFSRGTHEVQLGLRIGGEKRLKRKAPIIHSTLTNTDVSHNPRMKHSITDPDELEKIEGNETSGPKKIYLVVVKVFSDLSSADTFKKKLIEQKFNANIYYYERDKKYYVHIFETKQSREATQEIKNLKMYTKLKDIKLVTIDEK